MSDRLMNGEKLERGQSLTSRNGAYTLTLQDDGNLVLCRRRVRRHPDVGWSKYADR